MTERMSPRQILKSRGLKHVWVARRMGISRFYLSRLLSGERTWSEELQRLFALTVGMDETSIAFGPEETENE